MKFTVTMKDPDVLHDAIEDAIRGEIAKLMLPKDEAESLVELLREKLSSVCGKWFEYGEYLRVEIDTEASTCTVLESR